MICFLVGSPGISKTRTAQIILIIQPDTTRVFSIDEFRADLGVGVTTNPVAEDAINWRVFVKCALELRKDPTLLIIVDSTGISSRLPLLRYALGEYEQVMVRLVSSFPYNLCVKKWQDLYSEKQFNFILKKVMALPAKHDIIVDGKSPEQIAAEVLLLC